MFAIAFLGGAQAEGYPGRPITLIVGAEAGSAPDVIGRALSSSLERALATSIVIDNKPGGTGSIAASQVARAKADGYTLLLGTVASNAIADSTIPGLGYDSIKSFEPVAQIASVPLVLVVNAGSGPESLPDLIGKARRAPGKLNYASPGIGSIQNLTSEAFKAETSTDIVHVPYRGGASAVMAVLKGEVEFFFAGLPPAIAQLQAGTLRAFAVTSDQRVASLPDVPTIRELGYPGLRADNWHAIFAPRGTPAAVIGRLSAALQEVLKDPGVQQRLLQAGAIARFAPPSALRALVQSEKSRWETVVKSSGIRVE
ncbi:MAG: tripartite tricarboxylate transporter substrate binding protein [Xenophilus sp.]